MNDFSKSMVELGKLRHSSLIVAGNAKNTQANSAAHEKFGQSVFEKHGLIQLEASDVLGSEHRAVIRLGGAHLLKLKGLPPGNWYVCQPLGSQSPPDFLVHFSGAFFSVQFKLGSGLISWNDNHADPNSIYVFTDELTDTSVVRLGSDFGTPELFHKMDSAVAKIEEAVSEFNSELSRFSDNTHGYQLYFRPKWTQSGGREITNYAQALDREECFAKVIDFIEKQCNTEDPNTIRYSPCVEYFKDQILEHREYGQGIIREVRGDKIVVNFQKGSTLLKHKQLVGGKIQNVLFQ